MLFVFYLMARLPTRGPQLTSTEFFTLRATNCFLTRTSCGMGDNRTRLSVLSSINQYEGLLLLVLEPQYSNPRIKDNNIVGQQLRLFM